MDIKLLLLLATFLMGALGDFVSRGAESLPHLDGSACLAQMDGKLPYYVPRGFQFSGKVRRYFMAAEIQPWDYTPTGWDNMLGVPLQSSFRAKQEGLLASPTSIGTTVDKALYRGYTDANYTQYTQQPNWLGSQGPIIRAELGDMVEVMLLNKLTPYYVSLHAMGLFYTKSSEGALYWNGTNSSAVGNAIPPGGCFVFKWLVGNASSPDPGFDSNIFFYHSYVSFYRDSNAGLVGPIIVYNPGKMESVMAKNREFILLYSSNDEANSFLANHNLQKYLPALYQELLNNGSFPPGLSPSAIEALPAANRTFWFPPRMNSPPTPATNAMLPVFYAINGFIYANGPPFEMCLNDTALWYMYNMGNDDHAVHFHGHNVVYGGTYHVTAPLTAGQMQTALMEVSSGSPGLWEVICHFIHHQDSGMAANYIIYPELQCPLAPLSH